MPRNMSFMLTTEQIRNKIKTVTRRCGWAQLKRGEIVNACVKCMGLKKGEKIEVLCQIRVIDKRMEPLNAINQEDCIREGFPNMTPQEFVLMFMKHMKCSEYRPVNRIEFEYVNQGDNNRMNVSLKGRGEVSCQNSGSVAAPLQTTLF